MKEKLAKGIRVITVPPVMAGLLILIIALTHSEVFRGVGDILLTVMCLSVIPVLAYPLQPLIPGFKGKGRNGQRNLAFLLTIIGYIIGMITGYLTHVSAVLQFIFNVYFVSVLVLTLFNKVLHIRASGHACSIAGPLVFLVYFLGPYLILPCLMIASLITWSSLTLKRHTKSELAFGALSAILAFGLVLGITTLVSGPVLI